MFLVLVISATLGLAGPTPVAIFTSAVCEGHNPGRLGFMQHPESPERLSSLRSASEAWCAEEPLLRVSEPDIDATPEQLLRVHTPAHLELLESAFERAGTRSRVSLDSDTIVSPGSRAASLRAAGLVIAAVDEVFGSESELRRAFAMVRPPGHHAEPSVPMGFCLLNNLMVGVAHAQAVHGLGKVAILDFDVHHGNGDAGMSGADPSRMYASTHQSSTFPFTGDAAGRFGCEGQVLSAPLPAGAGSAEFRGAWTNTLLPAVREFAPEAIFLSAGFDAHAEDHLASLALTDDDFEWIAAEVARLGDGRLPIISVLEGGYNIDALGRSVRAHLRGLVRA